MNENLKKHDMHGAEMNGRLLKGVMWFFYITPVIGIIVMAMLYGYFYEWLQHLESIPSLSCVTGACSTVTNNPTLGDFQPLKNNNGSKDIS